MLLSHEASEKFDDRALQQECESAVAGVLKAQLEAGIDIVSDGEQPRVGFSMYVPSRMHGFGGGRGRRRATSMIFPSMRSG